MAPAHVPDGFASRWETVRGLRLVALREACGWRRLRWLGKPSAGSGGHPAPGRGRRRVRVLARLHGLLGDEPPLRVLNIVEYACASMPRAVGTLAGLGPQPGGSWVE